MRLVVVTEYCKSIRSQSGRQSQSDSVVFLICLKNSWALLALRKGFCNTGQHFGSVVLWTKIEAPACTFCVVRVLGQIPIKCIGLGSKKSKFIACFSSRVVDGSYTPWKAIRYLKCFPDSTLQSTAWMGIPFRRTIAAKNWMRTTPWVVT